MCGDVISGVGEQAITLLRIEIVGRSWELVGRMCDTARTTVVCSGLRFALSLRGVV